MPRSSNRKNRLPSFGVIREARRVTLDCVSCLYFRWMSARNSLSDFNIGQLLTRRSAEQFELRFIILILLLLPLAVIIVLLLLAIKSIRTISVVIHARTGGCENNVRRK